MSQRYKAILRNNEGGTRTVLFDAASLKSAYQCAERRCTRLERVEEVRSHDSPTDRWMTKRKD